MADSPVYKNYTQAELEAQYNQDTVVPDPSDYLRQWRELSDAATRRYTVTEDLRYGADELQTLDYIAATQPGAPLAIFLHGGWTRYDKSLFRYPALSLVPNGFAFATVNCHRVPDIAIEQELEQAREAVTWLVGQAETLGFDPSRICMVGHASGAYLAAEMIVTDWTERLGVEVSPVRSGLLASGVYDLEPVRLTHLNESLKMTEKEAFTLGPINSLPSEPCPIVVAWAERDLDEFRRQSRDFAAAWRRAAGPCNAFELPGTNHYDLSLEFCDPTGPLIRALQALFEPPAEENESEAALP